MQNYGQSNHYYGRFLVGGDNVHTTWYYAWSVFSTGVFVQMNIVSRGLFILLLALALPAGVALGQGNYVPVPAVPGIANVNGLVQFTSPLVRFFTYDGSPQFQTGAVPSATEFWQASGGVTGTGGVLYATNASGSGNVDGVLAAQNSGGILFGNANGILGKFTDLGGVNLVSGAQFTPSDGTKPIVIGGTSTTGRIPIAIIPPNNGALVMQIPDSTIVGGNARGNNAVDFQQVRLNASQVAVGAKSILLAGEQNTANAPDSAVGGFSCTTGSSAVASFCYGNSNVLVGPGASSAPGGGFANDWGNLNKFVFGSGYFVDNSVGSWHGMQILHASTNSTTATRLTAGNAAPAANTSNVANFNTDNTWASLQIEVTGVDMTAVTTNYVKWLIPNGYAARATGVASVAVAGMTATPVLIGGTGATATLSAIVADTTNGGINITVTAPNANRWHWSARIEQLAGG
jgi:hypothetical protein